MYKKVFVVIFCLWVLVLFARSAQYTYRIYNEFKNPPQKLENSLEPCDTKENFNSLYEERLYKYLKFGKLCEK